MKQKQDFLYILKTNDLKEGLIIINDLNDDTMRVTYDEKCGAFRGDYNHYDLKNTRVC